MDKYFNAAQNVRLPEAKWKGLHTWKLDGVLLGTHTINLHDTLSAQEAAILVEGRTIHFHLHAHVYRMAVADTPGCECRAPTETVLHVFYEFPLFREWRRKAVDVIRGRWRDLSHLLGGWNPWFDATTGQPLDWSGEEKKANISAMKAVLNPLQQLTTFEVQTRNDE